MKTKVKSWVQQERNMRGFKGKFPAKAPEIVKRKTPYQPKLPSEQNSNPFARQLASGDKDVRDATFVSLSKWLGAKSDIDVLDMKKIWKGLFYAMWHADGWDVQEELAEQMACLVHSLKHKVALSYVGVFYITARREWIGIDRHRMDKYLLLVRRLTSQVLRYCADREWEVKATTDVAQMMMRTALIPTGQGELGVVDVGLRLHVAELFVPELRKVAAGKDDVEIGCDPDKENEANGGAPRTVFKKRAGEAGGGKDASSSSMKNNNKNKRKKIKGGAAAKPQNKPKPVPSDVVEILLQPFAALLQFDRHAPLHKRIIEQVFEAVVEGAEGGRAEQMLAAAADDDEEEKEEDDDEDEEERGLDPEERAECAAALMVRLEAVTMKKMAQSFIELGAEEGVDDINRESLYELHTMLKKAAKRAAKAKTMSSAGAGDGGQGSAGKKRKAGKEVPIEPEPESDEDEDEEEEEEEESDEEEEESDEDEMEDSFVTATEDSMAVDEDESNESDEEESEEEEEDALTPSKRRNLGKTFDRVKEAEEEEEED